MRKIFYNQAFIKDQKLIESVYEYALKNQSLEIDVKMVLEYSMEFYKANHLWPSIQKIREKEEFKNFGFTEENFNNNKEAEIYLKEKEVEFKTLAKQQLLIELLDTKMPLELQMEKIEELQKTTQTTQDVEKDISSFEDSTFREDYKETQERSGGKGLMTNIPDIDELTEGISAGKLMVVIAPPKSFKTTFAINMCYINSLIPDNNSLFITLEIPVKELRYKMLIRHSYSFQNEREDPISTRKTIKGMLTEEEIEFMDKMCSTYIEQTKSKTYYMGIGNIKINTLSEFKFQLQDLIEKKNLKTIYIDYIQLFSNMQPRNIKDKYEYLNELVSTMRVLSVTHSCRFIILSQLTKEGVKTANKEIGRGKDKDGKNTSGTVGIMSPTDSADISALMRECYYMISLFSNDNLKISKQLQTQLLYHRDGETYADPKITFVIPQYFVIGNMDFKVEVESERGSEVERERGSESKTLSTIDLFSEERKEGLC